MSDTAATLYVQLGRLVRLLRQESEGMPLGPSCVSAMFTLARQPEAVRLGELAEAEGVRASTLTRVVQILEGEGYVDRSPDPDDGRAQRVALTESGRALVSSGQSSRVAVLRRRLESLSDADQARIADALPALEALLAAD